MTQNGQTTSAALGTRSQGLSIPALGIGVDTTSILESWQIGPDGIAYNSGWTIGLLNAGAGVPIPVVYSLGSFNLGAKGVGYTSPSIFGVGLPSFQLGEAPAGSVADGDILTSLAGALGSSIPTSLIVLDPKLLFELGNVTDPTGLGLTDPFGTTQKLLNPVFTMLITPGATVVAQALADSGTKLANKASKQRETTSGQLVGVTTKVGSAAEKASEKAVDGLDKISSAVPPQDEYPPITVDGPSTQESLNNNPIEYNPGNPEGSTPADTSTSETETPAEDTQESDQSDADVATELE